MKSLLTDVTVDEAEINETPENTSSSTINTVDAAVTTETLENTITSTINTVDVDVITETPENTITSTFNTVDEAEITETPASTTPSSSENTGTQSVAIVESENNNLTLVRVEEQNERLSVHPMITRSYRQISGRRPLHSPGAKKTFGSLINLTPKKLTPKNGVSKRYTPKARARETPRAPRAPRTPRVPKTPRPKNTPKKTPRAGPRSSDTGRLEQAPGPVTRRRSLYDSHFRGRGEKRRSQEDTEGNPNVSEHLVPSPHKKVRYNPIPSPNPIQVSSGNRSVSQIIGENSPPETSHDNALGSYGSEGTEGSQGQRWRDLNNIQSSEEEEPNDSLDETLVEVNRVEPPIDFESIVNRYIISRSNAIRGRADIPYEEPIPERTLRRTSSPSDISTSIDPEEIIERTVTKPSPKTNKSKCVLM